jgi:penicillin amidase
MRRMRIKYHRRPFAAFRDDNGVPHVEADDWETALYALGYLHAVDRPTQMLFGRVVASGRSAELIANRPRLFETDVFFRQAGLYVHLAREVAALDDAVRGQLQAYCDGVNDGLQQAGRSLPMWAAGFEPPPWDPAAVLLVGNLLNFNGLAVGQQQQERLILELIQAGIDPPRLRELFAPLLDGADWELLKQVKIASRLSDEALELITDLPRMAGSNAWAIAPDRSATGAALLACDPHLEVNRLPAIWYEAVLRFGDDYVMGATLPGCPTVAVGRTAHLAWGVTHLKGDTSDYFIEDCRLRDGRWQYRRGTQWHDFQVREETIRRKGGPDEMRRFYFNELGTLQGDPEQRGEGLHLLLAWTGDHSGAGASLATWLRLVHVRTTRDAMHTVRSCPQPTLCWVFADRQGHIGLQVNGLFPLRPAHCHGALPVAAWDPANHWRGFLPVESLPSIYDPPSGFLATANEPIDARGLPPLVTLPVPEYRKRRIDERLAVLPRATLDDIQQLQYDVVSLQARDLLAVLLPLLPDGPLRERLSQWDLRYNPESREATLFTTLYREVLLEIFGQDTAQHGGIGWRRMLYLCTRAGFSLTVITCIDRLLAREHSLWWQHRDKAELVRRAAQRLLLPAPEGSDEPPQIAPEALRPWSAVNAFRFTNRFFEPQLVGRALGFHTGDLPMPGCFATPFQGHLLRAAARETTFAPSYHFVTDLGSDEAWTNLPGGPSESRFSRWYKSDIPRWTQGKYKRLAPANATAPP